MGRPSVTVLLVFFRDQLPNPIDFFLAFLPDFSEPLAGIGSDFSSLKINPSIHVVRM